VVIKVLEKIGFKVVRQKGSHVYLKHPDGRATVVPGHTRKLKNVQTIIYETFSSPLDISLSLPIIINRRCKLCF